MSYYNSSSLQRYSSARMSRDDFAGTQGSSSSRDPLFDDIPDYGSAFVCGKSRFEEGKFHVRDDPILEIACGDEHTGVVTEKGRAFMFGSNNFGQLGLGHTDNVDKPSCVKSIKPDKVRLIACGRYHTLLTTEKGNIYSFGSNSDGQLGLGNDAGESYYNSPQRVKIDQDDWVMVAAGSSQSFALSKSGDLYAWGGNEFGELGLGRVTEQHYPKRVPLDFKVSFVACGYYHTAIISKSGKLFTCGSNDYYELGHNSDPRRFNEVDHIAEPITFVSCGGHHTVAIGYSGKAYALGDGSKGQLGLGEDMQRVRRPEVVRALREEKITTVSCGECHTAFLNDRGQIFSCGDNRYGKLGHNQRVYNSILFQPMIVEKFKRIKVENIACGGCHMILIGKINTNFRERLDDLSDDSIREKGYSDRRSAREYSARRSARRGSGSDDDMEQTFNRTHTLTRDNKFVPLSELNLKKAAGDDRLRNSARYNKFSDDESDAAYRNKSYLKPTSRYNTRNESSEDDRYGNRSSRSNVAPSMSITPYVSPFAKDDRYKNVRTLSRSNLKTLSDDSTDDDRYRRSRSNAATSGAKSQRRGTRTLSPKDLPKKEEKKKSRFCTVL